MPEHWTDKKHEPPGTEHAHLEVDEGVVASRALAQAEIISGPIQFTVGENIGSRMLEEEMHKIDNKRLLSIEIDKWGVTTCYDDMSGDMLDPALVEKARQLEVEYLKKMKVYDVMSRQEFKKRGQGKLIKGRWLDVNKGDSGSPDIRSRYVGKEFATGVDASLYAGTPPLEALKILMGTAASDAKLHVMLSDVK